MSIRTRSARLCSSPDSEAPIVDRFFHDEASIRRFVSNFEIPPSFAPAMKRGQLATSSQGSCTASAWRAR